MKLKAGDVAEMGGGELSPLEIMFGVAGVGLSHFTGQVKNLLSKITSVDQNNYPEMMGKTVIINAPGMFKMVWGMVKRFLDARTLSKIEVCSPSAVRTARQQAVSCSQTEIPARLRVLEPNHTLRCTWHKVIRRCLANMSAPRGF